MKKNIVSGLLMIAGIAALSPSVFAMAAPPGIICKGGNVTAVLRDVQKASSIGMSYVTANLIITVGSKTQNPITMNGLSELQPGLPVAAFSSDNGNTAFQVITAPDKTITAILYSKDLNLILDGKDALACTKVGPSKNPRPGYL